MNESGRQRHARPSFLKRREVLDRPLLVVEDQQALALMQAAMLRERWGCEVHIAPTLAKARELLASDTPYFAASCDLNLPDAPDGEVIDLVVAADIPTIAITAAFGGEMRQRMLDKGVFDYVLKNSINSYAYVCEQIGFISKNQLTQVLVVDDDATMRMVLGKFMERLRLKVVEADSAEAALACFEGNDQIRLVLVDYHMTGMNGVQLTQALRQKHGKDRLAIIGVSSEDSRLLSAEFIKNGANDFISKPFTFEEISCRVTLNLEMLNLIEENRNAAYLDYLTGLPNRRSFFADGPRLLKNAREDGCSSTVAMLDIDFFKRINDTHGHDAGDAALCHVADLFADSFPDRLVARLGGEEFSILLDDLDAGAARSELAGFLIRLENTPLDINGVEVRITASIGMGHALAGSGVDLDNLLAVADKNLYAAKAAGRNRVEG